MASLDINNFTLRALTIYGSDGGFVPNYYVLTSGTNGTNNWTNNLFVDKITASTIDTQQLLLNQNFTISTFTVQRVEFSTMTGNQMIASTLNISTITYSTLTGCTITASGNTYLSVVTYSTLNGSSIVASTINASSIRGNITSDSNILVDRLSTNAFSTNTANIYTITNNSITTQLVTFSSLSGTINIPNYCTFNQPINGTTLKKDSLSNSLNTITKTNLISAYIDSYINSSQEYTFGQSQLNRFVMVGSKNVPTNTPSNTIAYSNNGLNWTGLGSTIFNVSGNGVAYNGIRWVTVGEGINTIAYSDDGLNWTGLGSGPDTFIDRGNKVVWGNNMFVSVGASQAVSIKYSYDGIKWFDSTTGIFSIFGGYDIAWNGTLWFAVGSGVDTGSFNSIAYSYNGINWTGFEVFGFKQGRAIAWNGTMWIALGKTEPPEDPPTPGYFTCIYSYKTVPTSTSDWNTLPNNQFIFTVDSFGIAWNGIMWIAVGEGTNTMGYSYDGINWTGFGTSIFSTRGTSIQWTGTMWIASGEGTNSIVYSYDGLHWTNIINSSTLFYNYGNALQTNSKKQHTITFPTNITLCLGAGNLSKFGYSYDGITWNPITNSSNIFSISGRAANFNGKIWVAVGEGTNTIAYSRNPNPINSIDWIGLGTSIFNIIAYDVKYNGFIWVAVGGAYSIAPINTIAYSYDGINWIGLGSTIFSLNGYGVTWNGTMWIAVGEGTNTIAYSHDGINWTGLGTSIFTLRDRQVAWNGTMWIAVGQKINPNGLIAYSYNGINWTIVTNSDTTLFNRDANSIAWNGTLWVACGYGEFGTNDVIIAHSYNGINWSTSIVTGLNTQAYSVTWNGKYWIAVGQGESTLAYSSDGIYWNSIYVGNIFGTQNLYYVSWNQNLPNITIQHPIVATGQSSSPYNNTLCYSNDGIRWYGLGQSIFTTRANAVAWNGNYWVAVGEGTNTIAYSMDGIHWTPVLNSTSIFSTAAYGILWNGSRWIALGTGTNFSIAYSINTIEWIGIPGSTSIFSTGYSVGWNGSRLIALGTGTNTIAYSDNNGMTWTGLGTTTFSIAGYGICWKGYGSTTSRWIAVGEGTNTIAYSDNNGLTWTGLGTSNFSIAGYGISLGNTYYYITNPPATPSTNNILIIAVGEGTNTIMYSYDGVTWANVTSSPFSSKGRAVTWTGYRWVAVGEGTNTIAFSPNGINWIPVNNNKNPLFTTSGYGISSNSPIGTTIVNSQLVLNQYGVGLNNSIDLSSDTYYNSGFTNFTTTIKLNILQ